MAHVDPLTADQLVDVLTDVGRAEPPAEFPLDPQVGSRPGLYSWWADEPARALIEQQLGLPPMPPLVYAGQAGATRWPSRTRSTATLASRIRGNHINGNASSSTLRLTLSALLLRPLDLTVLKPGRLAPDGRTAVSNWIKNHLRVAIAPYDDRDSLEQVEDAVLRVLDPPLNLRGMSATGSRTRLTVLRRRVARPA